mmetsp:Transcript_1560/g.3366  ORF Transcript_1560/g.3366 Transcript_1560/m.3366 type:complete len:237 (+) Transcript_1560:908-1618(+)
MPPGEFVGDGAGAWRRGDGRRAVGAQKHLRARPAPGRRQRLLRRRCQRGRGLHGRQRRDGARLAPRCAVQRRHPAGGSAVRSGPRDDRRPRGGGRDYLPLGHRRRNGRLRGLLRRRHPGVGRFVGARAVADLFAARGRGVLPQAAQRRAPLPPRPRARRRWSRPERKQAQVAAGVHGERAAAAAAGPRKQRVGQRQLCGLDQPAGTPADPRPGWRRRGPGVSPLGVRQPRDHPEPG